MERLDIEIAKLYNLSRNKTQEYIKQGKVSVNDNVVTKCNYVVNENDKLNLTNDNNFVSRAAYKLYDVKDHFMFDFNNKTILDIGSSTGGFTQVSLLFGATKVYSVDVGSCQLADVLKNDKRVVSLENLDIRNLDVQSIDKIDIIVCDVSFISLTMIACKISEILNNGIAYVLIKPQFECGMELAKKFKGVIKDKKIHQNCIDKVVDEFKKHNLVLDDIIKSPLEGVHGNIEFVAKFRKV